MKKTTAYTFTGDDFVDYAKSFLPVCSDDMSEGEVADILHKAYYLIVCGQHKGIAQFCERRDSQTKTEEQKWDEFFKLLTPPTSLPEFAAPKVNPPLSRILPPVPNGANCQGLLFVGNGHLKNYGKEGLDCLKCIYTDAGPRECNQTGCFAYSFYAIDLTYPIEQVNGALARFGLDTLDRLYYPPKDGYSPSETVLLDNGLDCNTMDVPVGTRLGHVIGWKPVDGIKKAEIKLREDMVADIIKLNTPDQQAETNPPLSRILPPVPDGVNCQGLLFVGNGKDCNFGKRGLNCLRHIFNTAPPSTTGNRSGGFQNCRYAIDLTYPIEEVNDALSRFGFDTLDRLYHDMSSLPKSGLVHVLHTTGCQGLIDCEFMHNAPSPSRIGWRPVDGIKADRTEMKDLVDHHDFCISDRYRL